MERSKALEHLKLRIENDDIYKHSIFVEAIMRRMAKRLNEHENFWGITGLVHDIDYERINGDMTLHGNMGGDILEVLNYDSTIVYAVRAHNPLNNLHRRRKIDMALFCASAMADLIKECAQTTESKMINDLDLSFVLDYYNQMDSEQDNNKERIASCTKLDISLEEFIEMSLESIKSIKEELEP